MKDLLISVPVNILAALILCQCSACLQHPHVTGPYVSLLQNELNSGEYKTCFILFKVGRVILGALHVLLVSGVTRSNVRTFLCSV